MAALIVGLPRAFSMFGRQNWGGIPSAACIAIGALVVAWAVLQRTRAGLYIFSIGGNAEASRVSGIPIVRYKVLAYAVTGLFAGLAGIMVTSRVGVGQTTVGSGYELQSIATAVIGGVAIGGGIGRLSGVLLGVILLTVLTTGLDIAGVNTFFQQMVTGVVLIVAVLFARSQGAIPQAVGRTLRALGPAALGLAVPSAFLFALRRIQMYLPRKFLASASAVALVGTVNLTPVAAQVDAAEHQPMACDLSLPVQELTGAPHANENYTIAISVPSLANPYITALLYGASLAAEQAGVTLTISSGEGFMDPVPQIRQVENALTRAIRFSPPLAPDYVLLCHLEETWWSF